MTHGLSVRDCVAKFGFSHATWHEAVKRGSRRVTPSEVIPLEEISWWRTGRPTGSHLKSA